jgi:hypothetical protein
MVRNDKTFYLLFFAAKLFLLEADTLGCELLGKQRAIAGSKVRKDRKKADVHVRRVGIDGSGQFLGTVRFV